MLIGIQYLASFQFITVYSLSFVLITFVLVARNGYGFNIHVQITGQQCTQVTYIPCDKHFNYQKSISVKCPLKLCF